MEKVRQMAVKYNWLFKLIFVVGFIAAVFVVGAYSGIERIFNSNFVCTNGDYQSYNILRRYLNGQVPYRDFANYLGMGIVALCGPLLSTHNSFTASLFVTNMMASVCFILFVAMIFYLITGNKMVSAFAGLVMPKILTSDWLLNMFTEKGAQIDGYLTAIAYPGNSFRAGRMFLVVILCRVALVAIDFLKDKYPEGVLRAAAGTAIGAAAIGLITGLGMTWSNDFGFCCIGSVTLIMIILTIADFFAKKDSALLWKRFIYFLPALATGMLISVAIASKGNISSWFEFTAGVSQWQYTYYGRMKNEKILTLAQFVSSPQTQRTLVNLGIFFMSMIICLICLCTNKAGDRMILFVFSFVCIVAAQLFYIIGSGSDGFTECTNSFIALMFMALPVAAAVKMIKAVKLQPVLNMAMIAVIVIFVRNSSKGNEILYNRYLQEDMKNNPYYVAEMEGITRYANGLYDMKSIVGQDDIFSTYATALEDVMDIYQPTGSDYVIHALGDERFAEYVSDLKNNKYKWVQTTNTELWAWEIWTSRASWDLYREIYSDYKLHSINSTWVLWEYDGENVNEIDADFTVKTEHTENGGIKIKVTSEETRDCYADVIISWSTQKISNPQDIFTFRRVVFVEDPYILEDSGTFEGYFLKKEGQGRHIPVYMKNGYGEVTLYSLPEKSSEITVKSAVAGKIILAQNIIL